MMSHLTSFLRPFLRFLLFFPFPVLPAAEDSEAVSSASGTEAGFAAVSSASEKVKLNKQIAKLKNQALEIQQYEEKIHHLADQMIAIDPDDGVKVNYAKFRDVLEGLK